MTVGRDAINALKLRGLGGEFGFFCCAMVAAVAPVTNDSGGDTMEQKPHDEAT